VKLGILSDLHMEFSPYDFKPEPGVFYVNAGDIHSHTNFRRKWINEHEEHMFCVLGNHDYYYNIHEQPEDFPNVREVDGLRIAGATLWTDLSSFHDWILYRTHLIDTQFIPNWSQDRYMRSHKQHKDFLLQSEADVIVTHHAPSYLSIHDDFKGNATNVCFAVELFDIICDMRKPPKLWIHGHTHREMDYMIGTTRVINHPRGYTHEATYGNYCPMLVDI
jgi:Icc-related predicted phosphoesterase